MDKGRGFSDWIRFGDLSLRLLLEGVEDCCKDEGLERWSKGWVEGGRRFKLEQQGMVDSSGEAALFRCTPLN